MAKQRGTLRRRGQSWQADFGTVNGKRKIKSFKTKTDAENWLHEQAVLLGKQGAAAFDLTEGQRLDALIALEALKATPGASLEQAARFYTQHNSKTNAALTISELLAEFQEEGKEDGLRPRSLKSRREKLEHFLSVFNDKHVNTITRTEASKWTASLKNVHSKTTGAPVARKTQRGWQSMARTLLDFAWAKEYIEENPLTPKRKRRRRIMEDEKLPACLPWKQVQAVLFAAQEHDPSMVAPLALGFFAGLRTSELQSIDWQEIDLEAGTVKVLPKVAKKRRTRHVTIEPNLAEWLAPYRKASGPVAPANGGWRRRFDKVREYAGLMDAETGKNEWVDNAMRHSYASNHLVKHEDAAKTALQLGHRGQDVLFNHYRGLVRPQDAAKYWEIRPRQQENTITISQQAG